MQDDSAPDTETPDKKTEWAENRTDWAEDRTIQANERTFAGWMRTGMACVALALGLRALFGEFEPSWVPRAISTLFIFISLGVFFAARQNACKTLERLNTHRAEPLSRDQFTYVTSAMAAGAALTGGILWFL